MTRGDSRARSKTWQPDEIVCLPLYPQFSTTTTASSLAAWRRAAARQGLDRPTRVVCCYPDGAGLCRGARRADPARRWTAPRAIAKPPRLLLTAHGLPLKIVTAGDPYPRQVERTAAAVVANACAGPSSTGRSAIRAGSARSTGSARLPMTRSAAPGRRRAARRGADLVCLGAFGNAGRARPRLSAARGECGVPGYYRVPTVGSRRRFIAALASLVTRAAAPTACPLSPVELCAG